MMASAVYTYLLLMMLVVSRSTALGRAAAQNFTYTNTCQGYECPSYIIVSEPGNGVYVLKGMDALWAYVDTGSCESGSWDGADSQGEEALASFFSKYNLREPSLTSLERRVPICDSPMAEPSFPCCTFPHRQYALISCEDLKESNAEVPMHDKELGVSVLSETGCATLYTIFFNNTASLNEAEKKYRELTTYLDDNGYVHDKTEAYFVSYREPQEKFGYQMDFIGIFAVTDQIDEWKDPLPEQ